MTTAFASQMAFSLAMSPSALEQSYREIGLPRDRVNTCLSRNDPMESLPTVGYWMRTINTGLSRSILCHAERSLGYRTR